MRAHRENPAEKAGSTARPPRRAVSAPGSTARVPRSASEVTALSGQVGNRVVARLLKEERHTHGAGCGHDGVEDGAAKAQSALVAEAIRSESSRIPDPLRGQAESFFGNDFSRGRLHDGPVAQRAIEAMGARALTIDNHVFLPPPGARDMALIGHEFSHLNKNLNGEPETGTDNGAGLKITNPNQPSERTADIEGNDFAADVAKAPSATAQRSVADASGAELVQRAERSPGDAVEDQEVQA